MDESASRDLGSGHDSAGLTIDRNDDHQNAILGKRLAVADDNVSDSADAQSIDIYETGIDMARDTNMFGRDLDHVPDFRERYVVGRNAVFERKIRIQRHMAVLAVEGEHVVRVDCLEHI